MNIVILAAGFATRLYPLTKDVPKALLLIKNKPLLTYLFEDIKELKDIDEIVLVTNERYREKFESYLKSWQQDLKIKLITNGVFDEDKKMGALVDLKTGLDHLVDKDTLILASDTVTDPILTNFVAWSQQRKAICLVICDLKDRDKLAKRLGCVSLNQDKRVVNFEEKTESPKTTLAAVPYYWWPKEKLYLVKKYLENGSELDSLGKIVAWSMTQTEVFGFEIRPGSYGDIGTKASLTEWQ